MTEQCIYRTLRSAIYTPGQSQRKKCSAFLIRANVSFAIPALDDGSPAALQHFHESLHSFSPQINIWSLSDTWTLHAQRLRGANKIPWPGCLCCLLFSRRGDGFVCRLVHVGHGSVLWREKRRVRAENATKNIQVRKCASWRSRWRIRSKCNFTNCTAKLFND